MMKLWNRLLITSLSCILFLGLQAQETQQIQSINEGSIEDQFEFVTKKSTNWNDDRGQAYEVIKRNMFQSLQSHTIDSLNAIKAKYNQANQQIIAKQQEINTLEADLSGTKQTLEATLQEKESMMFLGMSMSKKGYSLLVWSVIIALTGLLVFFIFRFQASNVITKRAKNAFSKLENEFEEHRKKTLEREQKLKRQLQDELNKQVSSVE